MAETNIYREQQQDKPIDVLKNVPEVQDIDQPDEMFSFAGAWLPSQDPALIGPENFQRLINMRYIDAGIEGVTGYTKVNTTALSTYTSIKNGVHLRTQGRTNEDYVLVHAVDPNTGQGRVYENKTAIGSQGDFEATHIHADASVDLVGRFSNAPAGSVAYANTEEALIYSGDEMPIAGAFTTTDSDESNPIDVTEKAVNARDDTDNIVTLDATRRYLTILALRPADGIKVYIKTGNGTASTLSVKHWTGSAYADVTTLVDGTASGGAALAQTGSVTWDSSVGTGKLHHFEERYLYAYQVYLPAGSAVIKEISVSYPIQAPTNVWDGIYRTPIQCQVYTETDTTWEDFTLHVSESSTIGTPVGCILDGFVATNDQLIIMFDEKQAGIRMTMLGDLVNAAASQATVKYWDGSAWSAVTNFVDGTDADTGATYQTFGVSGLMSWDPASDEEKTTLFGTAGYAYQITVDTNLTGVKGGDEEVVVDLIAGVPAQQEIKTYKFPLMFKEKLFMCGYTQGNEGNRIDFSEDNAPDIFNGENTSLDGFQSIYVGGTENLTCGTQLYNRFGSNLFASLALFKVNEIYLLTGDSPLDYKLYPVSQKIGCPAPLTLDTAEVGFELGEQVARNVALFVSNAGPMMYDGATLAPIRGLEKYFDPNESISVNFDYLDTARGWFDSTYREYNMLLAAGTSQTTLNLWLVYDIVRKKWFQKDTGTGDDIQCGFAVIASNGDQYIYAGTLTGYMMQLENGASWAGAAIQNEVQTGDFFPTKNEWDISRIRRLKFSAKRVVESGATVSFFYYGDTDDDGGLNVRFTDATASLCNSGAAGVQFTDVTATMANSGAAGVAWGSAPGTTLDLAVTSGLNRLMRNTQAMNQTGWCHSFKFVFSSSETLKGMQPVMWGFQYEFVRKDHINV